MPSDNPICPHCGERMTKWAPPEMPFGGCTTWNSSFMYVCFNDQCPYFVKGWDWMWNNFHRVVSYRHMLDPESGKTNPVPVSSSQTLRDGIIRD